MIVKFAKRRPASVTAQNPKNAPTRSEEHTSELQSPCNLVCRLLLEKKKTPEPAEQASASLMRPACWARPRTRTVPYLCSAPVTVVLLSLQQAVLRYDTLLRA